MKKFTAVVSLCLILGSGATASEIVKGGCTENPFERIIRR